MPATLSPTVYVIIAVVAAAVAALLLKQKGVLGVNSQSVYGVALVLGGLLGAVCGAAVLLWRVLSVHRL